MEEATEQAAEARAVEQMSPDMWRMADGMSWHQWLSRGKGPVLAGTSLDIPCPPDGTR